MKENIENRNLPIKMESSRLTNNSQESNINLAAKKGKNKKNKKKEIIPEEVPVIKVPKEFEKAEGATIRFDMTMFPYKP